MMYETIHKCCILFVEMVQDAVLNPKQENTRVYKLWFLEMEKVKTTGARSAHHTNFHQKLTC